MADKKQESICPFCNQTIVEGQQREMTCPRCNVKYELRLRGLFIGRFQPLHNGHLEVIKKALEEVDELAVVIGSTQKFYTKDDPFTADERENMIRAAFRKEGITRFRIYQVADIPDDDKYADHVRSFVPRFDIVYAAANELTKRLFSKAGHRVRTCRCYRSLDATKIRDAMIEGRNYGKDWESMVPVAVAAYIREIKGVERVRTLAKKQ